MDTRKIATEYRLSHWGDVLSERTCTGESIKDFCIRIGISKNTYFYWQRKLREASCKELIPALKTAGITKERGELIPSGWAECRQSEPEQEESKVTVEIGRFRVTAGIGVKAEHLEKVCKVLMSLC